MFIDTETTETPDRSDEFESPLHWSPDRIRDRARLRVYIGAAAGVGKTYRMLTDARQFREQGIDVVIGAVETHGRVDTEDQIGDLEIIPPRIVLYRGGTFREMDLEAIITRRPEVVIVDELAHTNVAGSKNVKRYEDVRELVESGISVMTALNIQHLESLNDVVAQTTGITVRETIPDSFLKSADEVIDVDVSIDTLRTRLRQGRIYSIDKIEKALNNFFRKGNLAALRELALREAARHQAEQDHQYRTLEGLEQAVMPETIMVCVASRGSAGKLLRVGARIAGRLAAKDWFAVYVETPSEAPGRISPETFAVLTQNIALAERLGAKVIRLQGANVTDVLLGFARENEITHVIFGQSARSRWEIFWKGSIINRFLREVHGVAVHVIPIERD